MTQSRSKGRRILKRTICAAVLFVMVSATAPARAGSILDFSIRSGGVIEVEHGEHLYRFRGHGIRVGKLTYGANALQILGGRLAFSSQNVFNSNRNGGLVGSLEVRGCIDENHDGKCDNGDFRGILMMGRFLGVKLVDINGKEVLEARIVDQLNPQLAALLGLPDTRYKGELGLVLANLRGDRWWERGTVQGGLLKDGRAVPEAASLLLLGASLICLAAGSFIRCTLREWSRHI